MPPEPSLTKKKVAIQLRSPQKSRVQRSHLLFYRDYICRPRKRNFYKAKSKFQEGRECLIRSKLKNIHF